MAMRPSVAMLHRYVLPSMSAVARVWPPGLNATPYTLLAPGSARVAMTLPPGPHRYVLPSMSAVASVLPCGLYAAASTCPMPGPPRVAMRSRPATFHT